MCCKLGFYYCYSKYIVYWILSGLSLGKNEKIFNPNITHLPGFFAELKRVLSNDYIRNNFRQIYYDKNSKVAYSFKSKK